MSETKVRVGILGATGAVGQKLVRLLGDHPWFEVTAVCGSSRSVGKSYREAVRWLEPGPIPERVAALEVQCATAAMPCDLALSALDAETAREVEPELARRGLPVVTNAAAWRMADAVPLVVPEVNADHLALVERQAFGSGFIVANPNCCVAGLVLALKPLADSFGVEEAHVTTLQAVSGAGYPGVASLDILGDVMPFIPGEEAKIEAEPARILGRLAGGVVEPHPLRIAAHANRVPVLDGHLLCVSARLGGEPSPREVTDVLAAFASPVTSLGLPSAPPRPLQVLGVDDVPSPRRDSGWGGGMVVTVGRVRACPVLTVRFVVVVHNTVRGAAGAAVLNAELLHARGMLAHRRAAPRSTHASSWVA